MNNKEIINEVRKAFVAAFEECWEFFREVQPKHDILTYGYVRQFRVFCERHMWIYDHILSKHNIKFVGTGAARVGFEYTMKNGKEVIFKIDYRMPSEIMDDHIGNEVDLMNHEAIIERFPDAKDLLAEIYGSFEVNDTLIMVQEKMLLASEYRRIYHDEENDIRLKAINALAHDILVNDQNYGYTSEGVLKVTDLDRMDENSFNRCGNDMYMESWRQFVGRKILEKKKLTLATV